MWEDNFDQVLKFFHIEDEDEESDENYERFGLLILSSRISCNPDPSYGLKSYNSATRLVKLWMDAFKKSKKNKRKNWERRNGEIYFHIKHLKNYFRKAKTKLEGEKYKQKLQRQQLERRKHTNIRSQA